MSDDFLFEVHEKRNDRAMRMRMYFRNLAMEIQITNYELLIFDWANFRVSVSVSVNVSKVGLLSKGIVSKQVSIRSDI